MKDIDIINIESYHLENGILDITTVAELDGKCSRGQRDLRRMAVFWPLRLLLQIAC
jgi:hypothetical protein